MRRTKEVIKYTQKFPYCVKFPKLDKESLQIIGFFGCIFDVNKDYSSQISYMCFSCDEEGSAVPLYFKLYKARRITRSVMGAEIIAFSDLFDTALTMSEELCSLWAESFAAYSIFYR